MILVQTRFSSSQAKLTTPGTSIVRITFSNREELAACSHLLQAIRAVVGSAAEITFHCETQEPQPSSETIQDLKGADPARRQLP